MEPSLLAIHHPDFQVWTKNLWIHLHQSQTPKSLSKLGFLWWWCRSLCLLFSSFSFNLGELSPHVFLVFIFLVLFVGIYRWLCAWWIIWWRDLGLIHLQVSREWRWWCNLGLVFMQVLHERRWWWWWRDFDHIFSRFCMNKDGVVVVVC